MDIGARSPLLAERPQVQLECPGLLVLLREKVDGLRNLLGRQEEIVGRVRHLLAGAFEADHPVNGMGAVELTVYPAIFVVWKKKTLL